MNQHLTIDAIERWRGGRLRPDEALGVARHLSSCAECRLMAEPADLGRHVAAVRTQIAAIEHPDLETEIFAYVDGTLDAQRRARVEEHLAECARCREDVADARSVSQPPPEPHSRQWFFALAAVIVLAFAVLLSWPRRRDTDGASTPRDARPAARPAASVESQPAPVIDERLRLVQAPLEIPPVLRALRGGEEILRGAATGGASLRPAGVVVESAAPELSWVAPDGSISRAIMFSGDREVASSPPLRGTQWVPPALERGVTYTWEVHIEHDGQLQIVPSPPAAPARIHVLDARTVAELEQARRRYSGDPLVLGVLYARAGLEAEARAALGRVRGDERELAARHLRELQTWR